MVKTYKGYFTEDGRFVPDGAIVKLPVRRRAVVSVFDDEVINDNEVAEGDKMNYVQDRVERIAQILAAAMAVEDDFMTDDDWDDMLNLRAQTNAGLSRVVEI